MMDGIAASISTAVPSGRRSQAGDSSVRKIAMPKDTGTAMIKAMAEVASVPKIGTTAPKFCLTGSQSLTNRRPGYRESPVNSRPVVRS